MTCFPCAGTGIGERVPVRDPYGRVVEYRLARCTACHGSGKAPVLTLVWPRMEPNGFARWAAAQERMRR